MVYYKADASQRRRNRPLRVARAHCLRLATLLLMGAACNLVPTARGEVDILNAHEHFDKSTESTFDHMLQLMPPPSKLTAHWNDPSSETVNFRLIHTSPSSVTEAGWIGFGLYDTSKPTPTSDTPLMVGSEAVIGVVASNSVKKYRLSQKNVDGVGPMEENRQTLKDASVTQHHGDDGTVTTVLTFTKNLEEEGELAMKDIGRNTFLYAFGEGNLGFHVARGAFTLDFDEILKKVENGITSGNGGGGSTGGGAGNDNKGYDADALNACASSDPNFLHMVHLNNDLRFHWNLDVWSDESPPTVTGKLQYTGKGWVGLGVSPDGSMVGSEAVIGIPESGEEPFKYKLEDKSKEFVKKMETSRQTLNDATIVQTDDETVLTFTKQLTEDDELPIHAAGMNSFIYAIGSSNILGHHKQSGSFSLDLSRCESPNIQPAGGASKKQKGAWAAHGTIATLAWGIATPFAVATAWFRTLVPSSWIYVHVFTNVTAFFLTLVSVIVAVVTMSVSDHPAHFSETHHFVGLALFLFVTFQVMNGFLRPPVEKRDPYAVGGQQEETLFGFIKIPKSARAIWHFGHRLTGLLLLAGGIYQIQDGMNMFADDFGTNSWAPFFWFYIILFGTVVIGLKSWMFYDDYKARRGLDSTSSNNRKIGSMAAAKGIDPESELVPVQFEMH